jgi:hypothetical protein
MLNRLGHTVLRRITRILLRLAALVVAGFVLLVLIGLWSRYEQKTTGLDFRGIYERFFATQDGLSNNPQARTRIEAERSFFTAWLPQQASVARAPARGSESRRETEAPPAVQRGGIEEVIGLFPQA